MMPSIISSMLTALVMATVHVTATRFCQCENEQYGRIFLGINEVCSGLSDDWCSTNCNVFNHNCNYCQFIPAGYGNDADYDALKQWCYKQQGYDTQASAHYSGTTVYCYAAKNAVAKGFWEGGCPHEDNGDWANSPEPPSNPAPPAETNLTQVPPKAYVIVNYWRNKVHRQGGHECTNIYQSAMDKVADQFLLLHPECSDDKQRQSTANIRQLACPISNSIDPRIALMDADLDKVCVNTAGGDEAGDGVGAPPQSTPSLRGAAAVQVILRD